MQLRLMLDTDIPDAWRCMYCNLLIYNLEERNGKMYPAEGAPPPRFLSKKWPKVCVLCFDLYHLFDDNNYFMRLHTEWEEALTDSYKKSGWKP